MIYMEPYSMRDRRLSDQTDESPKESHDDI
jgi:hypothetical protein